MLQNGTKLQVVEDTHMIHIWPLFPLMKEAQTARNKIVEVIQSVDHFTQSSIP